jgi:putative hydrolase of the HAD superfamily
LIGQGVRVVLLDAGGVLILPEAEGVLAALRAAGANPDLFSVHRAHYKATAVTDANPPRSRSRWLWAFARACGVPPENVPMAVEALNPMFEGPLWTRAIDGAAEAVAAIASLPVVLAVVSNSVGVVADQLLKAGICQVGAGPGTPVAEVIDSAVVGVAKPDPAIFHLALARLGARPDETVYVGDNARIDVDGALAAGLTPLHLDPYGDCPDPAGQHAHLRRLSDLVDGLREGGLA